MENPLWSLFGLLVGFVCSDFASSFVPDSPSVDYARSSTASCGFAAEQVGAAMPGVCAGCWGWVLYMKSSLLHFVYFEGFFHRGTLVMVLALAALYNWLRSFM